MILVKRKDYEAKTRKLRNGREVVEPAWYDVRYYSKYDGTELAFYNSKLAREFENDCIYLRTELIGFKPKDTRSVYERAMECSRKDEYKYLFDMLKVDEQTNLSEYSYL